MFRFSNKTKYVNFSGSELQISQYFLKNPSEVGVDRSVTFNTITLFNIGLKRKTEMLLIL